MYNIITNNWQCYYDNMMSITLLIILITGGCRISYGGACYRYADIHQTDQIDWFGAQSSCSSNNTQGVVAYSNFADGEFQKRLLERFENPSNLKLWIGVRKRIWYWRKGKNTAWDMALHTTLSVCSLGWYFPTNKLNTYFKYS